MLKPRLIALLFLFSLSFFRPASAAASYTTKCKNAKCAFESRVDIGGWMAVDQITGYCLQDRKFVYLKWFRKPTELPANASVADKERWQRITIGKGIMQAAPTPVRIWNPITGENLSLYKCPDCPELFLPIASLAQLQHCPKCREATLEHRLDYVYD